MVVCPNARKSHILVAGYETCEVAKFCEQIGVVPGKRAISRCECIIDARSMHLNLVSSLGNNRKEKRRAVEHTLDDLVRDGEEDVEDPDGQGVLLCFWLVRVAEDEHQTTTRSLTTSLWPSTCRRTRCGSMRVRDQHT